MLDKQSKQKRFNICIDCVHSNTILNNLICTKCNCLLKTKTSFKKYSCPIGKW